MLPPTVRLGNKQQKNIIFTKKKFFVQVYLRIDRDANWTPNPKKVITYYQRTHQFPIHQNQMTKQTRRTHRC